MTTATITIQQANTAEGKPVTIASGDPREVYIGHPTNVGPTIGYLVGTVADSESFELDHITFLPDDPEELVGRFLVISEPDGFYTDTRVIERIVSHTEETA